MPLHDSFQRVDGQESDVYVRLGGDVDVRVGMAERCEVASDAAGLDSEEVFAVLGRVESMGGMRGARIILAKGSGEGTVVFALFLVLLTARERDLPLARVEI